MSSTTQDTQQASVEQFGGLAGAIQDAYRPKGEGSMSDPPSVRFEVIGGPEGACLAVFTGDLGERIAGPKPWGGGKTLYSWSVPVADVLKACGVTGSVKAAAFADTDVGEGVDHAG